MGLSFRFTAKTVFRAQPFVNLSPRRSERSGRDAWEAPCPIGATIEHSFAIALTFLYKKDVPAFPARRTMLPGFGKERRVASSRMGRPVVKLRDYGAVAVNRSQLPGHGDDLLDAAAHHPPRLPSSNFR
jgi:hypothetical protein